MTPHKVPAPPGDLRPAVPPLDPRATPDSNLRPSRTCGLRPATCGLGPGPGPGTRAFFGYLTVGGTSSTTSNTMTTVIRMRHPTTLSLLHSFPARTHSRRTRTDDRDFGSRRMRNSLSLLFSTICLAKSHIHASCACARFSPNIFDCDRDRCQFMIMIKRPTPRHSPNLRCSRSAFARPGRGEARRVKRNRVKKLFCFCAMYVLIKMRKKEEDPDPSANRTVGTKGEEEKNGGLCTARDATQTGLHGREGSK